MKVVILGGGLTGLFAAYELKKREVDYLIIEKETNVGGLCRSVKVNGFTFDYTGHFLHFPDKDSNVKHIVKNLLKDNLLKIKRNAKIYTKYAYLEDKLIPYPFQANIKFLFPDIRKKCFCGLIYSNLKLQETRNDNFLAWLKSSFGEPITNYFFLPYNSKLWRTNLKYITIEWVEKFVPVPNIEEVINNLINDSKKTQNYGYNVYFYYPKCGGIQALIESIYSSIDKNKVITSANIERIDLKNKTITFLKDNSKYSINYDKIISTIPIVEIFELLNSHENLKKISRKLSYTSVICFNLAIKKRYINNIHWIYFPDREVVFYRVGVYHNINENLLPDKNYGSLYVECSTKNIDKISINTLYNKVISNLIKTGILQHKTDILFSDILKIRYAYVIYNQYREKNLPILQRFLLKNNIYSIGRYGGWKYSYMAENIKDAIDTVNLITKTK